MNASPTITLSTIADVCTGTSNVNLAYTATTGTPDEFLVNWDAAAELAGLTDVAQASLGASPIVLSGLGSLVGGTYNGEVVIENTTTGCVNTAPFSVTINDNPTITLNAIPSICLGTGSVNLGYLSTTGSPNEYALDWVAAAETAGLTDVSQTSLPASPIAITGLGGLTAGTYDAGLAIYNTTTGCTNTTPIQVTVNANPTITLSAIADVCIGTSSVNLGYTATTETPDEFLVNWDGAAETAGLTDVAQASLGASPIVLSGLGSLVAGTYNGQIGIENTTTGCVNAAPFSVTINDDPTITLSAIPDICSGSSTAVLAYTAHLIPLMNTLLIGVRQLKQLVLQM